MTSFFHTVPARDGDLAATRAAALNPWRVGLGVLAGLLVLGGVVTVAVGLSGMGNYEDVVLGQSRDFDQLVATAIVGGAAIVLGIVVGAAWLVLGATGWSRRD